MVKIAWHSGTGNDFFVSLYVLNHADEFGLRPSWAAGVRSRLPTEQRDFLEQSQRFLRVPLTWLASLPQDKRDAKDVLSALEVLAPEKRLEMLLLPHDAPPEMRETLADISARADWSAADLDLLRSSYARRNIALRSDSLMALANAGKQPEVFGERYLEVLNTYYQVFFSEEEERIRPLLQSGQEKAQEMAAGMAPGLLVEQLSRGVHLEQIEELDELALSPSFWASPLIFFGVTGPKRGCMLFGIRTGPAGLVPGENVPEGLVETLKALADPTRLRILRYLSEQPFTPSELARRLRLRAPTVVHHLKELRLAGLVQVSFLVEGEKRYALRRDALRAMQSLLDEFLSGKMPVNQGPEHSGGLIE
ncbi:MAG TPA: metalloregulator ArsR/SmtB family transcription factor [Longilinea sp.]|nr:metalloregulator ArsR/SmtB family transcription factor [Longilinea sp.]